MLFDLIFPIFSAPEDSDTLDVIEYQDLVWIPALFWGMGAQQTG
jgi:hypothetical protein